MIGLEALRCFCAIVETGGFRHAAERLHRTQPAVSQQLKALERAYGHTLIERHGCQPTPAGHVIYARARRLLEDAANLDRELRDFDESVDVPLRLGASDTSAMYYLPKVLREFARRMPRVRLELSTKSSAAIEAGVLEGELDLGIVTLPARSAELDTRPLFEQRLVLVVPRTHELATRRRIALKRLRDLPLLLLDESTRTGAVLQAHFRAAELQPKVNLRSGSFEVIKHYVAEGLGLSILPEIALGEGNNAALATVRLPELPAIAIGAVWRRRAYQPKAAAELLALMSE
jgi:DNA-binding transcriptional LysR family regulator